MVTLATVLQLDIHMPPHTMLIIYLVTYYEHEQTSKAIDYISQLQLKVFYYPLLMSILCSLILMKYQGSTCVRYRHISYPYINTCIWSIFCIRVLLTEWIKIHSLQTKKLDRWGCGVAVKSFGRQAQNGTTINEWLSISGKYLIVLLDT